MYTTRLVRQNSLSDTIKFHQLQILNISDNQIFKEKGDLCDIKKIIVITTFLLLQTQNYVSYQGNNQELAH